MLRTLAGEQEGDGLPGNAAHPFDDCAGIVRLERVGSFLRAGANDQARVLIKRSADRQGVADIGVFSSGCSRKCWARRADDASSAIAFLVDTIATCIDLALASETATGGSSMITSLLVPPMPNALTPARRGPGPAHLVNLVGTKNGEDAKSIFGLGVSKCRLGGISPVLRQWATLIIPASPEMVLRWPILDFSEPMPQNCLREVLVRRLAAALPSRSVAERRGGPALDIADRVRRHASDRQRLREDRRLTIDAWRGLADLRRPVVSDGSSRMTAWMSLPSAIASSNRLRTTTPTRRRTPPRSPPHRMSAVSVARQDAALDEMIATLAAQP